MTTALKDTARYPYELTIALPILGWLALAAGYGVDALIGGFSGCRFSSIPAVIGEWHPWAQTAVLGGHWLLGVLAILAAMWWVISLLILLFAAPNESMHHASFRVLALASLALTVLGALIPVFSQSICVAT